MKLALPARPEPLDVEALQRSEEHLRLLVDTLTDLAVICVDTKGYVVSWNAGAQQLMGYRLDEIGDCHLSTLYAADGVAGAGPEAELAVASARGRLEVEGWRVRKDGSRFWASTVITPLGDARHGHQGSVCVVRDITERRTTENTLRRNVEDMRSLATRDPLTRLHNRREFDRLLSTRPRDPVALLAIDVDNLKTANDRYGHEAGDLLLRGVATTLSLMLREADGLARLGGDEFGAILQGVDSAEAMIIAERMRVAVHGISLSVGEATISVGCAAAPVGADLQAIWRIADEALYRAKRGGRDRVVCGDGRGGAAMGQAAPSDTAHLAQLLEGQSLATVYQPIFDLRSGDLVGHEALARPYGAAPTDRVDAIFRTARRTGRIRDLDWLCRRSALAGAIGLPGPSGLFINVSLDLLLDPHHPADQLALLLAASRRAPGDTVLEISVSEDVPDIRRLRRAVDSHRELGVRFALDDVAAAHPALELIAAVEPEYVKLDRSLTARASGGAAHPALAAVLDLARSRGAVTVAEGVDGEAAAAQVRALGIDLGQGFGLRPPAPAGGERGALRSPRSWGCGGRG